MSIEPATPVGESSQAPRWTLGPWLFLRALGVVQLIAFISFDIQLEGLIGARGILPVAQWTEWDPADLELHAIAWLGMAAAVAVVFGRLVRPMLLVVAGAYLGLMEVGGPFMSYQWDTLLVEATIVAIPLAHFWREEKWAATLAAPPLFTALAVTWLNVRLVFSSGVVKLRHDVLWRDLDALQYHWWTQPQPGPLAWHAYQLPDFVQSLACAGMLLIELVGPILILLPRVRARRAGAFCLMLLQVAIFATGNYGFFNLLAFILCLPALDDALLLRVFDGRRSNAPPSSTPRRVEERATIAAGLLIALGTIPFFGTLFGWSALPDDLRNGYAELSWTRAANPYGLFATMTTERWEFLFEGTEDGETWHRYELPARPDDPARRPPQVAPHLPRLDWALWFAALGSASYRGLVQRTADRLEQAEPAVLGLFRVDPFDGRRPLRVRVVRKHYEFTPSGSVLYWQVEDSS